jgi:protein involved in polysaccharide export with SLBB domain
MRKIVGSLFVVLLVSFPIIAWSQESERDAGITLRPGDVVKIQIWREPDLSGSFPVDESGIVVLPLLGEQRVSDVPIDQVRNVLVAQYREYLRNPSITITPLRRIQVLGEVNLPGVYEVDPTITLAGAVALAGGATPMGDLNRIRLVRGHTVLRERVAAGEALDDVDVRSGDHVLVDRRSWFERNSTFLISVGLSVPSVIAGILALVNR